MLIQVLVLQRSCKLFGAPETRAESLGCFKPPCATKAGEREEERSRDAVVAGAALPKLPPWLWESICLPLGEKGPSHPMGGEVWELRCPVLWATELAEGYNAGDTLSSDGSRWLCGGGLRGSGGGYIWVSGLQPSCSLVRAG